MSECPIYEEWDASMSDDAASDCSEETSLTYYVTASSSVDSIRSHESYYSHGSRVFYYSRSELIAAGRYVHRDVTSSNRDVTSSNRDVTDDSRVSVTDRSGDNDTSDAATTIDDKQTISEIPEYRSPMEDDVALRENPTDIDSPSGTPSETQSETLIASSTPVVRRSSRRLVKRLCQCYRK